MMQCLNCGHDSKYHYIEDPHEAHGCMFKEELSNEMCRCKDLYISKEVINHPDHYGGDTPYEAIKVIEAWGLNFNLGNLIKYIKRCDSKNGLEDLKKGLWYLEREIANREIPQ